MLIRGKLEEISATISYYEIISRSAKFTPCGNGNFCVPKISKCALQSWKWYPVKYGNNFFSRSKSPSSCKQWLQGISRYGRKGGANIFNADNALVCEFHFNPSNINISFGKNKKSSKRSAVPSLWPENCLRKITPWKIAPQQILLWVKFRVWVRVREEIFWRHFSRRKFSVYLQVFMKLKEGSARAKE